MRVVRKGPDWTLEIECPGCQSLLEIEEGDLRELRIHEDRVNIQLSGERYENILDITQCSTFNFHYERRYGVDCCVCNTAMHIPHEKLPPKIRREATDRNR